MGPFELALVTALGFSVPLGLLDFVFSISGEEDNDFGKKAGSSFGFFVVSCVVLGLINFEIFYFSRPALTGPFGGWAVILIFNALISAIFWGFNNMVLGNVRLGFVVAVAVFLFVGVPSFWMAMFPFFGEGARNLASLAKVVEQPQGSYPETDADHILLVPEEAALYKARQVIAKASDEKGRNLSTLFSVYRPALQSVNDHLYWIFNLRIEGWRVANQINRIVPGYIVVDAEDPNADAQMRLGHKMVYTIGAPTGNSADRHIYNSGYRGWIIDDLTIEVRDDWKPYYSASLNRRAANFKGSVPEKMILMDPETGEIQEYGLDNIPEWVDRVYSRRVVHDFTTWWGRWGNAPWKFIGRLGETAANRSKPAGQPTLVYTKGKHPAWQILMTSWNKDTSVTGIFLFDGRSRTAKLYPISGIAVEETALKALRTTKKTIKTNIIPVHPAIHKIFGRLTYVAPYISLDENHDGAEPFQGVGIVPVDNVDGANVIVGDSKAEAFREYRQFLARGSSNAAPEENSLKKTIEGTVVKVAEAVIAGNTNYFVFLDSDKKHVFQGVAAGENLDLPFARPGVRVQITYLDTGKKNVDIIDYVELPATLTPIGTPMGFFIFPIDKILSMPYHK